MLALLDLLSAYFNARASAVARENFAAEIGGRLLVLRKNEAASRSIGIA